MASGTLEVVLLNARCLKNKNFLGKSFTFLFLMGIGVGGGGVLGGVVFKIWIKTNFKHQRKTLQLR